MGSDYIISVLLPIGTPEEPQKEILVTEGQSYGMMRAEEERQ
jgi:hypothetical protein